MSQTAHPKLKNLLLLILKHRGVSVEADMVREQLVIDTEKYN